MSLLLVSSVIVASAITVSLLHRWKHRQLNFYGLPHNMVVSVSGNMPA